MRPHTFAAVALSATLLLTACGSGGGTDSGSAPAKATPATKPSPFAGQTPEQILEASSKAATAASSVHVKGAMTSEGETTKLDLILSGDGTADGKLGVGKDVINLRKVGETTYVMADSKFWSEQGFGAGSKLLSGKWLKVPANTPGFAQFSIFTDMDTFFKQLLEKEPSDKLSVVPGKTSRGQQTVGLLDSGKDGGTLYVAADEANPVPVALLPLPSEGKAGERILFYDWDAPVTIADPPAEDTIDASKLG